VNAKRILLLALLAFGSSTTMSAESARTILSNLGRASFRVDIPEGWERRKATAPYQASTPLFDLVPIGATPQQESPNATFVSIKAAYYPNRTPVAARLRWEPKGGPVTELPRIDGLPSWSMFSGIGVTAFAPIGDDVVLFSLLCSGEQLCTMGKKVLLEILASYREVEKGE
jgi:hypothetical protein